MNGRPVTPAAVVPASPDATGAPAVPAESDTADVAIVAMLAARLRKYRWALLTPVASLVLAALTNAVASRLLGPERFGAFTVATTTATLLGIAMGFGMPATMVRYAGRFAVEDREARMATVRLAWRLAVIVACVVGVVAVAAVFLRPAGLDQWVPGATGLWIVVAAAGLVLTEMAAANAQLGLRFGGYFGTMVGSSALRFAGIALAIVVVGPTLTNAVAGFAIGYLAGGLVGAAPALGATRGATGREQVAGDRAAMLRFGAPVVMSAFIIAAISAIDTLTVAAALGAEKTGWYAAAVRLSIIQVMLLKGIDTLALPVAMEAVRRGEERRFARRVLLVGGGVGLVATAVLLLATPLAVQLVYGSRYLPSVPLYRVYALGLALNFVGNPLSQLLYARSRPFHLTGVHVAQLVALLVGLPLAARRWDLIGVVSWWAIVNWCAVLVVMGLTMRELSRGRTA